MVHRAECNSVGPHDNQRSESKQWTLVILPAYKLVIQSASQWTKIKKFILKLFGKTKTYQVNYRISSYKDFVLVYSINLAFFSRWRPRFSEIKVQIKRPMVSTLFHFLYYNTSLLADFLIGILIWDHCGQLKSALLTCCLPDFRSN